MDNKYALFDLDKTILPFDTQLLFCNYVLKRERWRTIYLIFFLPFALLSFFKLVPLGFSKRMFFTLLMGINKVTLDQYVDHFLDTDFNSLLYNDVLNEIKRHKDEGRILILNSASPTFYLHKISKKLDFDEYIGTEFVIKNKINFCPKLHGKNNKGDIKIFNMIDKNLIDSNSLKLKDSWSYSDSFTDIPLLSVTDHSVMVNPDANLLSYGKKMNWELLKVKKPYLNKFSESIILLKQLLGFYKIK